jgi:hypothetical protein
MVGRVVKLVTLQPALACPPPVTDAEVQLTLTADSGTVAQPMKLEEVAPTVKVHVRPFCPLVIFQATVATEPPAMLLPGLFAVNGIVLGVARSKLTVLPTASGTGLKGSETTGVDWRVLTAGF